ncbi:MAG: exopolysaccharide biosynthesis protein [Planctomycetota bacterium]
MATLTPADLFGVLRRRWFSVLVTTALVTAVAIGGLLVWPDQYSSDGLFYVRLGRGAVAVDPATPASQSVSIQDARSNEVISIVEMLGSREIVDRVVTAVGAREVNRPRNHLRRWKQQFSDLRPPRPPRQMDLATFQRQLEHEKAVERVRKSVGIKSAKDGYTVAVHATTEDPMLSREIVKAYLDEYNAFHVQAHENNGSFDFFKKQTEQSRLAAFQAQQALQQRRNELGWMSIDRAEEALQSRIIELSTALDVAESELADASEHSRAIQQQLTSIEPWVPTAVTRVANKAADDMKTALYEVQVNDSEELASVTSNHPRFRILQKKLDQGSKLAGGEQSDRAETVEAINPTYQAMRSQWETARAKAAGLKGRRDSLAGALATARGDLQRLNQDSIELSDLALAAKIAETNYLSQSASMETARFTYELDRENLSDVSVIQNASLNLTKTGPHRAALSILAMLAGLCLGAAQALLRPLPGGLSGSQTVPDSSAQAPLDHSPSDHAPGTKTSDALDPDALDPDALDPDALDPAEPTPLPASTPLPVAAPEWSDRPGPAEPTPTSPAFNGTTVSVASASDRSTRLPR